jgi:hypothetical protein
MVCCWCAVVRDGVRDVVPLDGVCDAPALDRNDVAPPALDGVRDAPALALEGVREGGFAALPSTLVLVFVFRTCVFLLLPMLLLLLPLSEGVREVLTVDLPLPLRC